jgi:hypothetical protein
MSERVPDNQASACDAAGDGAGTYVGAYPFLRARRAVWREIARRLTRDAPHVGTLVELGAGYCDFINEFPAKQKIAFDLNPEMRAFADPEVDLRYPFDEPRC